jgi:hypothetical protein
MTDEYLSLTVLSRLGEDEAAFKTRLSQFWTHMLRNHPDSFEKVYAETVEFDSASDRLSRQYLFEAAVVDRLERELTAAGIDHEPIDRDDHYSKYEATPPHWMWIEH